MAITDSLLVTFLKDVRDDYLEVLEEDSRDDEKDCSWSPAQLVKVRILMGTLITKLQEEGEDNVEEDS